MGYRYTSAELSVCGLYRYALERDWRESNATPPATAVFVMLNPSTADADKDDPTIRRCVAFAKRLTCNRLLVLNLFAYRTPSPKALLAVPASLDPVGVRNKDMPLMIPSAAITICAWGAHGAHMGQDKIMMDRLGPRLHRRLYALGDPTKDGHPRHPLYLPTDARLRELPA